MFKRVVLAALIASLVVPLAAQAPAGWKVRLDRSKSAQDPDDKSGVTFMAMGKAFTSRVGPRAFTGIPRARRPATSSPRERSRC